MAAATETPTLVLRPTEVPARFIRSRAFVKILMGPRGEGKTTAGYLELLYRSEEAAGREAQERTKVLPLRVAIVRDTWTNLNRTTIESLRELEAKGLEVQWRNSGREAIIGGDRVHCLFFGMDTLKSISKLQGLGIGVLWIEEPAPAADLSGGVAPEVFGVGITSLRQQGVRHGCLITMNPPDEDHWVLALRSGQHLSVASFTVPKGENPHISEMQRDAFTEALEAIGRKDLVARLIEGRVGQIQLGEAVMPEFNEAIHVADRRLYPLPGIPLVRLWDFGLNPTCTWTQVTPSGYWHVLACFCGENMGVHQLIENFVKPWEADALGPEQATWPMRDIGDPMGVMREQSNSERSAVTVLGELLDAGFEPGPVEWHERRDALKAVLTRPPIRGKGPFLVDAECTAIRRALRGGWRYPKDGLGRVMDTVESSHRASGKHAHPGHTLCYGAAILYPIADIARRKITKPKAVEAAPGGWLGT